MHGLLGQTIYVLCAATAFACALLLLRAHQRTGTRLLLWAGVCFVALTMNNVILYLDLVMFPEVDMSTLRAGVALAGVGSLLYGLVWEETSA